MRIFHLFAGMMLCGVLGAGCATTNARPLVSSKPKSSASCPFNYYADVPLDSMARLKTADQKVAQLLFLAENPGRFENFWTFKYTYFLLAVKTAATAVRAQQNLNEETLLELRRQATRQLSNLNTILEGAGGSSCEKESDEIYGYIQELAPQFDRLSQRSSSRR